MANTIVNRVAYARDTQLFLRSSLVSGSISRSQFKSDLYPGRQIVFPYASTARVQDYSYSTDATIDATTLTSNGYSIDQVKISTSNYDPLQNVQTGDMNWQDLLAQEQGYQLSRNIDQYALQTGVTNALNTVAGGTLNSGNMFEALTDCMATLGRARAGEGTKFAVIDYDRAAVLANTDKANGFNTADAALRNGFIGNTSAGFKVFVSNDLPYSVTLTLDTQPANGETFTLAGKTWTWVTDGTAASAGELNIGANLADAKAIFLSAVNGTTPPAANDYIDFDSDTRRELLNTQLTASAFAGDVTTITAYGKIAPAETMGTVTNIFGTETVSLLTGLVGAIDLTVQEMPEIDERPEPKNKSYNILATTQYGAGVFYRNKAKLCKLTANA